MKFAQESIFTSSIRAMFTTIFVCIGFFIAFIPLVALFDALFDNEEKAVSITSSEVIPYAENLNNKLTSDAPLILQVDIHGVIGSEELDADLIQKILISSRMHKFQKDRIKGVLLNIRSPGGTAFDSDVIFRAILKYKENYQVPVYAFVDGICASGGVYVASAADKIFATQNSFVGSVGVFANFMNLSKTLDMVGAKSLTLKAGKNKDTLNPLRPWEEGEEKAYQDLVDFHYNEFLNVVTENRPQISRDALITELGANVFPAPLAKSYGLVDDISNYREDVIEKMANSIGLEAGKYQVVRLGKKNWLQDLFKSTFSPITQTFETYLPNAGVKNAREKPVMYLFEPGVRM